MRRVSGQSLGGRLSRRRRNRIAYLALLRRSGDYSMRAWAARSLAVAVVAISSLPSSRNLLAAMLCLLPAASCYLLWANEWHLRNGTKPRFWPSVIYLREMRRTNGLPQLSLGSYLEVPGALMLIAIPSWVATDVSLWSRLLMLAAATLFLVSAALSIYNDHAWFNPAESRPPAWHEVSRWLAGPIATALALAIVLPAQWGEPGCFAALVIALLPLTMQSRISDTDLIVKYLAPLVREESHAGRELVISETPGALSTHLRLLEQQARAVRDVAPSLYELAVSANSRLRETLNLSQMNLDSSTSVQNLEAPVLTLARAVGAKAEVVIEVDQLNADDRDLARLVLNDLVGNALNAGASAVSVRVTETDSAVSIAVTDDAPAMAVGVWKTPGTSSARLETRLRALGGSLTAEQQHSGNEQHSNEQHSTKTVTARWTPGQRDARTGADGQTDGTRVAR